MGGPSSLSWRQRLAYNSGHGDFCETNFAVSPHVVEWWNTWSSVAMMVLGLIGLALAARKGMATRHRVLYLLLAFVGAGSTWFHATLSSVGQLSDEIPMIWTALGLSYALIHVEASAGRNTGVTPAIMAWLAALLVTFGAAFTYSTIVSDTPTFFRVLFGVVCAGLIAQEVRLYCKYARNNTARRLYQLGLASFLLAFTCWIVEQRLCASIQGLPVNPQLHSWWHLLVSLSCHLLFVWVAYLEALIASPAPAATASGAGARAAATEPTLGGPTELFMVQVVAPPARKTL